MNINDMDLGTFLPSVTDNKKLNNNWIILIGHIIAEHLPAFQWIQRELPNEIPHRHMAEAKQKSEVVCEFI